MNVKRDLKMNVIQEEDQEPVDLQQQSSNEEEEKTEESQIFIQEESLQDGSSQKVSDAPDSLNKHLYVPEDKLTKALSEQENNFGFLDEFDQKPVEQEDEGINDSLFDGWLNKVVDHQKESLVDLKGLGPRMKIDTSV